MRGKHFPCVILTLVCLMMSAPMFVVAAEGPSEWAIAEVTEAIEDRLVPEVLQSEYQVPIKRYEYVLLGLQLLKHTDVTTTIIYERPFSDVANHPYEKQIIEAYNVGLISGYEDGTFRADQNISRQEIATLVANLYKLIDDDVVISQEIKVAFSDEEEIGDWASRYVSFCYANGLIKGIGKDRLLKVVINPKGEATREQAIILFSRLSSQLELNTALTYEQLSISEDMVEKDYPVIFEAFIKNVGSEAASTLYELSQMSYASFIDIGESSVTIRHSDGSELSVSIGTDTIIGLMLMDSDNQVMKQTFIDLSNQLINDKGLTEAIITELESIIEDPNQSDVSQTDGGTMISTIGYEVQNENSTTSNVYEIYITSTN